jgi:hypothetical protein
LCGLLSVVIWVELLLSTCTRTLETESISIPHDQWGENRVSMVRVAKKAGDIDINEISNNRFRSIWRGYTKLEKQQNPGYRQGIL